MELRVLAQIFGVCTTIMIPFIYMCKDKNKFYALHIALNTARLLQYLCLSAWTGALSGFCSIVKNGVYLRYSKHDKQAPLIFMLIFVLASICISALGFTSMISILPLLMIAITGYGNWQHNYIVMCICNIIAVVMGLFYNFVVCAYGSIPANIIEFIAAIVGIIRHYKTRQRAIAERGQNEETQK